MFTRCASAKSSVRTLVALGALALLAGMLEARPWMLGPGNQEGRWKLDEGTGTSAADSSGNGNTGTLTNGPAWVAGQSGQGLSFDGIDDFVSCGVSGMPAANAAQTISWWMNYASVPSGVGTAIDLHNDASSSGVQTGFRSGKVTVWKHGGGVLVDASAPSSNGWHHFAYTFDGTTHRLYVDGTQASTSTVAPQTATPTSLVFGRWNGGAAEYYGGKLDEVRIYSRAVSAAEAQGLAHGGALEAWYKLDEGSGTTAGDLSGSKGDGTLTNGPTWVAGQSGQALQFDGVNDTVSLGTGLKTLRNVKAATLACWVNMDSGFGDSGGVSYSIGAPPGTSSSSRAALEILSTGAIRAVGRASDTESGKVLDTATGQVVAGTWTHVACVIRYDTGSLKLYKNGAEVASGTVSFAQASTADTDSKNAALGSQDDGSSGFHKGKMDEVRVYSRALSAGEIAGLAGGTGTGLAAVYYDNIDWTGSFITRTDAQINFQWGTGFPDASIGADTFSAVWTGQVQPQATELYTFYTNTDDGVRLWVDGKLVVDFPQDQAPTERSGQIALVGGTKYNLRMEYFENGGGAVAELRWSSPSTPKALIPQSQLYPTDTVSPLISAATGVGATTTTIYLRFSEAMDKVTAETAAHYTVSVGGTVTPVLSQDKRLVTATLQNAIPVGTGTVTLSSAVLGITREALQAPLTKTVVAGNNQGFPDSTAITLTLSSDTNQSVIQKSRSPAFDLANDPLKVTLTVRAPGTAAKTVDLGQMKKPGGQSTVFMGLNGNDRTATVTTSGGTPNEVNLFLRADTIGAFDRDFEVVASDSTGELGRKMATSIDLSLDRVCLYSTDHRPLDQTITVTPTVQGVTINAQSFMISRTNHASASTLVNGGAYPATDAQGKSKRIRSPLGLEVYNAEILIAAGHNSMNGVVTDYRGNDTCETWDYPEGEPGHGTSDYCSQCQNAGYPDTGPSVDLSDGEKKIDARDLVIRGRGMNFMFRRVYRGHNYRKALGKPSDFGEDWTYSYADEYLKKDGTGSDETANYLNFRGGQSGGAFVNLSSGKWQSPVGTYTQLRKNPNTGDFEIREEDGDVRVYHNFSTGTTPNKNGRLKELRDRNENRITLFYEQLDPDNQASGDEKFVLAYAVDTLGREIRYTYFARTAQTVSGRELAITTTNTAAFGRLSHVEDFKGNMDYTGATQPDFAGQDTNRRVVFGYDSEGNLTKARSPIVLGTPTGNNFPNGRTTRYRYYTNTQHPGFTQAQWDALIQTQKDRLLRKLTHIWYPNEVRESQDTDPADTDAAEVLAYETNTSSSFLGFVTSYTIGGTNGNGVPSGGTISYTWTDLNPGHLTPINAVDSSGLYSLKSLQVDVVDRNGNDARYIYGGGKNLLEYREFTLDNFRSTEPDEYLVKLEHQNDRLLKKRTRPEGDIKTYAFNEGSTDRFQQSNMIRAIQTPDSARGGDQPKIEQVFVYNPIYNEPCLVVFARGADMNNNGFTPPISDPANRTMTDPYDATKTLNMRYVLIRFFDFQESPEKASQAPASRKDKDGSAGQVNQSPLIGVDANVLTTEVWLVQVLSLTEDSAGLTELRARLSNNLTKLGLGDLNGDGDTTPAVAGNIIRQVYGSPVLLANTNHHKLETDIETAGDLIDQTKGYDLGGTAEGTQGNRLQTIVTMYQYNAFGQMTKTISPEGNVRTYAYFPENDADGDSNLTPTPADGRTLDTVTGGYLKETLQDTTRSYLQQTTGTSLNGSFSNNLTNPTVTDIKVSYTYDDVGNPVTMTNGRGIRSDLFVNELDETIQTTSAADVSGAASANPSDPLYNHSDTQQKLTAFAYKSRTYFDYNGNVVLSQTEDRGNTSAVDGSGLGTLPSQATGTTPGLSSAESAGGDAYVDHLSLYDRLNNPIETRVEVDSSRSLNTRYRFDGNQHQVLVIYPEGNADSTIFDERELVFQQIRGASSRPSAGKYASGDPTAFDRPGGSGTTPSTTTYNYDKDMNPVEVVDAADTDLADSNHAVNNSSIAGSGDVVAKYTYDGYNRLKSVRDADGNEMIYIYDPDSNVVRVIQTGDPVDDVVPSSFPDSQNKTLSVTETIYDELSRAVSVHRVLFQTPDASPSRTPTLTDTVAMDSLAAYLSDASTDTASVPGAIGITVIGRVTSITEYDRESRGTFRIQDDLDVHRTDYDGAGRVVKTTDDALSNGFSGGAYNPANISGNTVEMAYDDNSNTIEVKETDVTAVANVTAEVFRSTMLYDSLNRLQTAFNNLGQAADVRYDSRGNQVTTADAVGSVSSRSFSRRGLGSIASVTINNFGNVTRSTFDGLSRLLETETRLTSSGQGDGTNIGATLEGVKTTAPTVDTVQSGDGLISVYYAYDDNSQLLGLRDDDGNVTGYIYDNQNRGKVERKGLGVTGTSFTLTGGDSGAFNVSLRGGVSPVDTESAGTDITRTYDLDSNVTTLVDEAGNSFVCTYDALNRKKSCAITKASGFIATSNQSWKYDGLSRLGECTDDNDTGTSDDVTCKYFYDSLSRPVEESQQIGSGAVRAYSCGYELDCACGGPAEGLPSECTFADGRRVHNIYDRLDRLISRNDVEGTTEYSNIATYQYIGRGRVAVLTYQNNIRLTHIGQVSSQNADVGFDGLRRIVNHRWESFTSQALGAGTLLMAFEHQDGNSTPAPMYDRANNKRIEYKTHDPTNSEQYKYDSAYRLTSTGSGSQGVDARGFERGTFTNGNRTSMSGNVNFFQDWDLEGLGNWTRQDDNARVETRSHSDFNEIDTRTVSGNNSQLTYDKNGNTTDTGYTSLGGQTFPGGGLRLVWDALNRLRQVYQNTNTPGSAGDDVLVAEYLYDCHNRRMQKVVTNSGSLNGTTRFYYQGWRVMEERDGSDALLQQYTYGNFLDEVWTLDNRRSSAPLAWLNDNTGVYRHFYLSNTLYHVYGLTNEGSSTTPGTLKEAYQYDAYGKQTVITDGNDADAIVNFNSNDVRTVGGASTINGNPYMYTGQRVDSETGLMYYKSRYYEQNLGRFLSRDPKPAPDLYEYVGSTPTVLVDPSGALAQDAAKKHCDLSIAKVELDTGGEIKHQTNTKMNITLQGENNTDPAKGEAKCATGPHDRECCQIAGWIGHLKLPDQDPKPAPYEGFKIDDAGKPVEMTKDGKAVPPNKDAGEGLGFGGDLKETSGVFRPMPTTMNIKFKPVKDAGPHTLHFYWHDATMLTVLYRYMDNVWKEWKSRYDTTNAPRANVPYNVTMPFTAILVDTCQKKVIDKKSGVKKLKLADFSNDDSMRPIFKDD